ncbi:hypothetical protein GCM10029978_095010 [Actinoallomurus acanthiterrae]
MTHLEGIDDLSPLAECGELRELHLHNCRAITGIDALRPLGGLRYLTLRGARLDRAAIEALVDAFPDLRTLSADGGDWCADLNVLATLPLTALHLSEAQRVTSIEAVARFPALRTLTLRGASVTDLGPLAGLSELRRLDLESYRGVADLEPLRDHPKLRYLFLQGAGEGLDLSPLARIRHLTVHLAVGQSVRGLDRLHRTARIEWHV